MRYIASIYFVFAVFSYAQNSPIEKSKKAARQQWFYDQRAFPQTRIPAGARLAALEHIERHNRPVRSAAPNAKSIEARFTLTTDTANWTMIGPQPTGGGTPNATAGRINAIAIDPRDNNTVYIGAAEGGVWKTTDGGTTWTPLTDQQASLANGAIAIDPSNPDTIYVGTGEENFAGDNYYGAGILKSTDAGATWRQILGPFLRDTISSLAVHPENGTILLCAAVSGIWRSADAGETWTLVISGGPGTSIAFDPADGSSVYAAIGNPSGNARNGVYHSKDAGLTWTKITGGFPVANVGRISLAIAPSETSTIYAQVQDASSSGFGNLLGIWKTTNAGASWSALPIPLPSLWGNSQWYDIPIAVSPVDANVVYSGGLLIQRSLDGGQTWSQISQSGANGQILHVDEHVFAFTNDGSKVYIGNDGGAYSTVDIASSRVSWKSLNDTLAITQFYPGMSIHPSNPLMTLAGAQDNGTQRFIGSVSWDNVACGDGGYTNIDPSLPAIAYSACQYSMIEKTLTLNGTALFMPGQYGIDQTDVVSFIAPFVLDPANPQTAYFGTYRVWQSVDGAGFWNPVSPDLTGGKRGTIRAIAVAPSDSNTVYAGTSNGRLVVTSNMQDGAGAVWKDVSAALPISSITQIAVDPLDASIAYVTFSGFASAGHVFKTPDRGSTWFDISGNLPNLPVNGIVIDPDLPGVLYIATDAGVMMTSDGGATWTVLGSGLPKVVVSSLVLHRPSRILRAATHGRSVWDLYVPVSSSVQPSITAILPSTANAGDAGFKMNVVGSHFSSSTVIRWNGQPRPTSFVDSSHLSVDISDADIQNVGRATLLAFDPTAGASNAASFTIGPAPKTSSDQFVSSANPFGGSALAPRSLGALYGSFFAPSPIAADTPPLPFTLGGVTLSINNNPTPLLYVSQNVILFQVPFFAINGPVRVTLTVSQGTQSTSIPVTLQPYSPALFSMNAQGTGQGAVLVAGTASIAAPSGAFDGSRPAHIGEYISIYCTGLGDVTPRPALGSPSPSNPLATTNTKPTVTIGDAPANVSFSGLVPGRAGLYVVNVQIPDNAPTGEQVPVMLKIGGLTSNTVTIAVDQNPTIQ